MVTLEEALWISRNRLPGEPADELASWRAARPPHATYTPRLGRGGRRRD